MHPTARFFLFATFSATLAGCAPTLRRAPRDSLLSRVSGRSEAAAPSGAVTKPLALATAEAPPSSPPNAAPAKPLAVEVEGSSRDESRRAFRLALAGNKTPSLREDEALRMVEAALRREGFPPGLAGPGEAPLQIKANFTQTKTGFGFFGGHTHTVRLEAFDGARLLWEFHASGPGEQDDIRPVLSSLLAAGSGLIGRSTAGRRTVNAVPPAPPAERALDLPPRPKRQARRGLLQR